MKKAAESASEISYYIKIKETDKVKNKKIISLKVLTFNVPCLHSRLQNIL